jgi:hypothetical protein
VPAYSQEFNRLAVVFVGSFNPAIFHPEWCVRQGMMPEADLDSAKVEVISQDVSHFEIAGVGIEVLHERLQLYTQDQSKEAFLQDLAQAILAKLPHTPINGCGLNCSHHYHIADEGYWHKIGHTLAPKALIWEDLLESPGMEALTIKGVRTGDYPGATNLTIQPSKRLAYGLFVSANTHYEISGEQQALPMEKLKDFITTEWVDAFGIARRTAETIFEKIKNHD